MGEPPVPELFDMLLSALRGQKSLERTERDRYVAVVVTQVELAQALFMQHCIPESKMKVKWDG